MPFAQRGDVRFDHVEPVVKILAEAAGAHFLAQIPVGGAENAQVNRELLGLAHRAHRFFLNRAQQFHLHVQRQVGHFVEEQGAAVRFAEQAFAVFHGAGEAALAVAEEFALHQFRGNRAAVDRHERLFPARAQGVDQTRHALLAAAGFAADVDRRLAARQFADLLLEALHGRPLADQGVLFPAAVAGFLGAADAQAVLDQLPQAVQRHRFGDEVVGAQLHRVGGHVHVAVGGDHRHRHVRGGLGGVAQQVQAGAVAQVHIGQAEVEAVAVEQAPRGAERVGRGGIQFHPPQGDDEQFAQIRFVVNNQNTRSLIGHHYWNCRSG